MLIYVSGHCQYEMHAVYKQCRWIVYHTTMANSQLELKSSAWEMQKLARYVYFPDRMLINYY